MMKQAIITSQAPTPIGAYSQAIQSGHTVYISGQIPLDPASGQLIQGDVMQQCQRVLDNLKHIAEASGGSLAEIVKLTVYLTDLKNFSVVNAVMMRYFDKPYPARAVLEVRALPLQAEIEIEAVMVKHPDQ